MEIRGGRSVRVFKMAGSKSLDKTPQMGDRSVRIKTGTKFLPAFALFRPLSSSSDCFLFFKSKVIRK